MKQSRPAPSLPGGIGAEKAIALRRRPGDPMADRRTARLRTRGDAKRAAIAHASE